MNVRLFHLLLISLMLLPCTSGQAAQLFAKSKSGAAKAAKSADTTPAAATGDANLRGAATPQLLADLQATSKSESESKKDAANKEAPAVEKAENQTAATPTPALPSNQPAPTPANGHNENAQAPAEKLEAPRAQVAGMTITQRIVDAAWYRFTTNETYYKHHAANGTLGVVLTEDLLRQNAANAAIQEIMTKIVSGQHDYFARLVKAMDDADKNGISIPDTTVAVVMPVLQERLDLLQARLNKSKNVAKTALPLRRSSPQEGAQHQSPSNTNETDHKENGSSANNSTPPAQPQSRSDRTAVV